jgi:MFS family permease
VRNRATWPGFFLNLGLAGAYLSFAGLWAVPYLTEVQGMSRARATAHTTAMLVAFALASLATGRLSDRMGRRKPLILALGAGFVLAWLPWLAGARPPLAASLALFAAMGACAAAFTLSWAVVKEVNPPALSGTAMAVVNTGVFLGPTVYQPLVGWVVDRHGFRAGLLLLCALSAAGAAAALLLRETRCRNLGAP